MPAPLDKQVLACHTGQMTAPKRLPTAQRRLQIAEAALRILASQGVHRLTSAALADQVGIADGTIFRHFKNKEEIVNAAIDLFEAALDKTYPPAGRDPLERLGLFFVNRLALVRENPEFLRLAFNDRLAEAAGSEGAERVGRLVERSVAFVHDCLREAQDRGEVSRDAPLVLIAWMVIGAIRGASTPGPSSVHGAKALARTPPRHVWNSLERFLRTKETSP